MELILQLTSGLAGGLLILYKIKSYSLIWNGIKAWGDTERADIPYLIYASVILWTGTAGNLLCVYCLLKLASGSEPDGVLFAISAIMIVFACLPEKTLGMLRKLNDWYLAQKAGD